MPITIDYSGKLVLVTGGGRGIGLAISTALAEGGADIALTYTSQDATSVARDLSKKFGVTVKAFKCDVAESKDVSELVQAVEKSFGKKVDIGVANAGISLWKDAHENTDEDLKHIFDVNTFGPFYLARQLVRSWLDLPPGIEESSPASLPEGKQLDKQILFVSSISGLVAMNPQKQTAYNSSKAALTMLAKSLAMEWASLGITVNSISPGYVLSDMIANPPDEKAASWSKEWKDRTPVGRFATTQQIGDFVAVMLSNKQGGMGFMTGSDVVVDGGYTGY